MSDSDKVQIVLAHGQVDESGKYLAPDTKLDLPADEARRYVTGGHARYARKTDEKSATS